MITFRSYNQSDESLLAKWFDNDMVGKKYLPFYSNPKNLLSLLNNENRFLYIINNENEPIGFFDFEIKGSKGHFSFYISPEYRGKGLGKVVLESAFNLNVFKKVNTLEVGVDSDNVASVKILEQIGFIQSGIDKDGMLIYIK